VVLGKEVWIKAAPPETHRFPRSLR
jgi:predicted ArsR family transcriptional regulator